MMVVDMPAVSTTLEDLLAAWSPDGHPDGEATCLVCAGETHRVELRSGVRAWACRECGSILEDAEIPAIR
jgi:hypothetical protein